MDDHSDSQRPALPLLTTQQRQILSAIEAYCDVTHEPCPGRYLARRFSLHHSTIQKHLSALYRKGWLRAPNPPSRPNDW